MEIWELAARTFDKRLKKHPWTPWYDTCDRQVVLASSEEEARKVAADSASNEGKEAWLLDKWSTCKTIDPAIGPCTLLSHVQYA